MGGMSALIPSRTDAQANERAFAGIRSDKTRDATDGYDGGWVAHPGLVDVAMAEFVKVLGDKPNQFEKQRPDVQISAADLLNFKPEAPITENGLRNNVNVGIHYLAAWLAGKSAVRKCGNGYVRPKVCWTMGVKSPLNWCAIWLSKKPPRLMPPSTA